LNARRDSIAQRVGIIQEIDGDRYVWPHIMDEVARALPDYTWLEDLLQTSPGEPLTFRIVGQAGNNFAVTQFMENLEGSPFVRNVELVSTEQEVLATGGINRIVNRFELEAEYERPPPELLETVPLFAPGPSGQ
jgi:Tfp pilus assembly protein PilN